MTIKAPRGLTHAQKLYSPEKWLQTIGKGFEALEEHRAAGELVLPDLLRTEVDSEKFSGRAKVLKELFEHHADEEEKEMFKRARALMGKEALETLGDQLARRKVELKKQAEAA